MDGKNRKRTLRGKKSELENSSGKNLAEEYDKLKEQENRLDDEIAKLKKSGVDTNLKPQMDALHEYNQMKDITQIVLGYLADLEQTTVGQLHKQFNLPID